MGATGSRIPFDEVDPFNPDNRVRGSLLRSKRRRGDLLITHVNGEACEQAVFGAPRIHHLDEQTTVATHDRVVVFDKIDGSNVLLFRYCDSRAQTFVSYKTRLSPFLRNQAYGDFVALWREVLERHASEMQPLLDARYAFAFEMFGHRLRILTDYDVPLDARLLYALDPVTGAILDPETDPLWTFPRPDKLMTFPTTTSAMSVHREVHARCERPSGRRPEEGAVVYFLGGVETHVYKVKPRAVKEAQARYRELYGHAKRLARHTDDADGVLRGLDAYVHDCWTVDVRAIHGRVAEIVRNDIGRELRFDQVAPAPDTRASAVQSQTVLWESIWGSHLWGMQTETSDRDRCIVYQLDHRSIVLGAFDPPRLEPFRHGWKRKSGDGDEHWYELGRVIQLLLSGSVTMLYGVLSPHVATHESDAHAELRALLDAHPSRVFHRGILGDLKDSEKLMRRAKSRAFFLKHLRVACRNLQFAITLFTESRYEFRPSAAMDRSELDALRVKLRDAFDASSLPFALAPEPFHNYLLRWRRRRRLLDERSTLPGS